MSCAHHKIRFFNFQGAYQVSHSSYQTQIFIHRHETAREVGWSMPRYPRNSRGYREVAYNCFLKTVMTWS